MNKSAHRYIVIVSNSAVAYRHAAPLSLETITKKRIHFRSLSLNISRQWCHFGQRDFLRRLRGMCSARVAAHTLWQTACICSSLSGNATKTTLVVTLFSSLHSARAAFTLSASAVPAGTSTLHSDENGTGLETDRSYSMPSGFLNSSAKSCV